MGLSLCARMDQFRGDPDSQVASVGMSSKSLHCTKMLAGAWPSPQKKDASL